jgi:AmmeMemoRadiSam system protein A
MSPQPDLPHSSVTLHSAPAEQNEFSAAERRVLLEIAHHAIAARIKREKFELASPSPHLGEPRGAFTTIYLRGMLRGCVGYVFAAEPLYRTVADTACAAAFDDSRFQPVSPEEAPELEVHLSVLSSLQRIEASEVEVGRHGLLISLHGQRGLLLPQVPIEHNWNRVTFLAETCRKAGLPADAWQNGATIEAFTAEVFGDSEVFR